MDEGLRFLELVRRELAASDAYLQFGGRTPDSPSVLCARVADEAWRIVVRFEQPLDPPEARTKLQAKLDALVSSFTGLGAELQRERPRPRLVEHDRRDEVDEALTLLAEQAKALRAVVLDEDSPVLWGSSELPAGSEDVEVAMWTGELVESALAVGLDMVELIELEGEALERALEGIESAKLRQRLLRKLPQVQALGPARRAEAWAAHFATCRAIAALRRAPEQRESMGEELGWFAREFAGIYHVLLVYPGPFSELDAARPMRKALPLIERLVLALPPVEPPPKSNLRVLRPV